MYTSAYEEVEGIRDISERIGAFKKLSKRISQECPNSSWYDFIRGVTLFYEHDIETAFEIMEKAFMKDKNIVFCEKLIQVYSDAGNREKEYEWMKKRDNLRVFERAHIDAEEIEEEQCALRKQLEKHDGNQITLAMQYIDDSLKKKGRPSCLKILKRWSSSTPLLARGIGANMGNGGGLYIRWKNFGIAIDPGINFIQNMAEKGISVLNLDYIIVAQFWGGKGDIRNTLAKYLTNECLKKKKVMEILPGDVNLSFDLMDDSIECSRCGNYCTENDIKVDCSDGCIEYVCSKCVAKKL